MTYLGCTEAAAAVAEAVAAVAAATAAAAGVAGTAVTAAGVGGGRYGTNRTIFVQTTNNRWDIRRHVTRRVLFGWLSRCGAARPPGTRRRPRVRPHARPLSPNDVIVPYSSCIDSQRSRCWRLCSSPRTCAACIFLWSVPCSTPESREILWLNMYTLPLPLLPTTYLPVVPDYNLLK